MRELIKQSKEAYLRSGDGEDPQPLNQPLKEISVTTLEPTKEVKPTMPSQTPFTNPVGEVQPQTPSAPKLSKPSNKANEPEDKQETRNGILSIKSAAGDMTVVLSPEDQMKFVERALRYQDLTLHEKRANAIATLMMAFLSGVSAAAIGVTLYKSTRLPGKTKPTV